MGCEFPRRPWRVAWIAHCPSPGSICNRPKPKFPGSRLRDRNICRFSACLQGRRTLAELRPTIFRHGHLGYNPELISASSAQEGLSMRDQTPTTRSLAVAVVALISACSIGARAEDTNPRPDTDAVPCASLRKNPDGTWQAIGRVTIKIGSSTVTVADNKIGHNAIKVGDTDVATFLDQTCGRR